MSVYLLSRGCHVSCEGVFPYRRVVDTRIIDNRARIQGHHRPTLLLSWSSAMWVTSIHVGKVFETRPPWYIASYVGSTTVHHPAHSRALRATGTGVVGGNEATLCTAHTAYSSSRFCAQWITWHTAIVMKVDMHNVMNPHWLCNTEGRKGCYSSDRCCSHSYNWTEVKRALDCLTALYFGHWSLDRMHICPW